MILLILWQKHLNNISSKIEHNKYVSTFILPYKKHSDYSTKNNKSCEHLKNLRNINMAKAAKKYLPVENLCLNSFTAMHLGPTLMQSSIF